MKQDVHVSWLQKLISCVLLCPIDLLFRLLTFRSEILWYRTIL